MAQVVILGGGAVGSVLAGLLSRQPGLDVCLVGRAGHVAAIRGRGLRIRGQAEERFDLHAVEAVDFPLAGALLLVTVKAGAVWESLSALRPFLRADTVLLLLQNGLGVREQALTALEGSAVPAAHVHRGVVAAGATLLGDGLVRFFGGGLRLEPSFAASPFADVFGGSALKAVVSEDFERDLWSKLLVNCVVNPLSVLLRARNNVVADPAFDLLKGRIVAEVLAVAAAEGVPLDRDVSFVNRFVTSDNVTSMLQDVLRGRRTEIGFLNGAIVERGRKHGLPTPVNETLTLLVEAVSEVTRQGRSYDPGLAPAS